MSETPETSIVVRFSTKLNGYQIPLTSFNIPSTSTRLTLSKLINHLLSLPQTVPFDFIISNEFLRTTLEEHLKTHEISSERIIDIEYTLALPAPQTEWSCQQENWISELSFTDNFVFSALSVGPTSLSLPSRIVVLCAHTRLTSKLLALWGIAAIKQPF